MSKILKSIELTEELKPIFLDKILAFVQKEVDKEKKKRKIDFVCKFNIEDMYFEVQDSGKKGNSKNGRIG